MTAGFAHRSLRIGACVVAAAAIFTAGSAWGAVPFVDIAGNTHANNIYAMRDAAITVGCVDSEHYCPSDPVRRDQMASFLARLGGLSFGTTKNFPRANAKGPTQSYCSVRAANPASFKTGPCGISSVAVDFGNTVGQFASAATGSDGLPVISYWDNTNGDLRMTHCGSPSCSVGNNTVIVDNGANVGQYTSIAIGLDGMPIISYYDQANGNLKVAHCGDLYCIFPNTVTTVDTGNGADVGLYTSITMSDGSLPIISYYDQTNMALKVAHCTNFLCTGVEVATVDNTVSAGVSTSIVLGLDALPVISYRAGSELRVVRCETASCTGARSINVVDSGGVGADTSIAIGIDGFPIVSYLDHTNGGLKVAHCNNSACAGTSMITLLEGINTSASSTSIAIATDGKPLVAYYNSSVQQLRMMDCLDTACTNANVFRLDGVGSAGGSVSAAIGVDGLPTFAYYDGGNGDLRVVRPAFM